MLFLTWLYANWLVVLLNYQMSQAPDSKLVGVIKIDLEKVIHITDERYLSVTLDSSLIRNEWEKFSLTEQKWETFNFT